MGLSGFTLEIRRTFGRQVDLLGGPGPSPS